MSRQLKSISEVVWFQEGPGVRKNQYTNNGVKLLNVANLTDSKIDLSTSTRYISCNEAYGKYKHFLVDDGDLIIASSGIKVEYFDKKMGFVTKEQLPLCMNTSTIRFKAINNQQLNIRYFMYYLKSRQFKSQLAKQITGSAQLNFGPSHLKKMHINLVDLDLQNNIVSILDKLEYTIECKKQQLFKYEELVKSRFIEMFGDSDKNEKGYIIKKLETLANKISDGVHSKPIYTETGKPFISVVNINRGIINFDKCKFVSEADYQKMIKSTHPEMGDVLYTKVGATYGIPAYVDTNKAFCLYVSVCLIKPKSEKINGKFLALSMRMPYVKRQADSRIKGIGVPNLHLNQIKKFDILCPPIKEQEFYVAFSEQVDKSKFECSISLNLLESFNYYNHFQA